jgi:hypothetical protein
MRWLRVQTRFLGTEWLRTREEHTELRRRGKCNSSGDVMEETDWTSSGLSMFKVINVWGTYGERTRLAQAEIYCW